ncbi:hypothetical protein ACUN24_20480 [Pedobacter sp. WC2501]|uniref:hypothetical protein n=1 Tax=Pedobacter sp. WC2501 TaxID=3461400 RepID=UPI0040467862
MNKEKNKLIIGAAIIVLTLMLNLSISLTDYRLSNITLSDFYMYQALGNWEGRPNEKRATYRSGVEESMQVLQSLKQDATGKSEKIRIIKRKRSIQYFKYPKKIRL